MQNIAARIAELDQLHVLLAGLSHKKNSQLLYGTEGSARHLVMAAVRQATGRPLLIVTPDALQAGKVYEDLTAVFGEDDVWLYPGKDLLYYHDLYSASGETPARRIAVLAQLAGKKRPIVVTTVSGLVAKMCPPGPWQEGCLTLQTGEEIPPEKLLVKLIGVGYERVELVEVRGQVSVRGGIMDIFPMAEEQPVRIEYFGDQIESVRRFDPVTQRSLETVEFLLITPALEVICGEKERRRALSLLAEEKVKLAAKNNRLSRKMLARLEELYAQIRENIYFTGMEQNLLYFYEQPVSLAEWFPADALFFLSDPLRCAQAAEQLDHELGEIKSSLFAQGELLTQQVDLTWPYEEVLGRIKLQTVAFSLFAHQGRPVPYRKSISLSAKPVPRFQGQWQLFTHEITQWRRQHYSIVVLTGSRQRSLNVSDILAADGIPAAFARSAADLQPKTVTLLRGSLDSGFILPEAKLAVLTEQDLLPQRKKSRRIKGKEGIRIGDYQELAVGDYVVHEQHGIGQYLGLRTLEVGGTERDYIYIQYAGNDKLYLPVEQIDLVRKYIGVEGKKPKLSALGGGEWSRIKARVQASVQELAKELLALYAARETEPGHAFPPDHPWEADFAASFPFEETPDQLQAIAEIKADMQKSRPMDRLLCGDVGYGKTEVALRAAFKAILDGMQAAFLVPTTILAQQHYRTFTERLQGFPVTVGILSRFQSKAEQKATLQGIRDGTIDLVVGTHRLLSKDVRFKSLGLLVIDEEQRFGV
ncbi:MAG TPA: DEAD/DEAH box helicase, partial [Firmicutes bacterium]|nr:DEAD/DEAH box helicase [Bacillota bacterium]